MRLKWFNFHVNNYSIVFYLLFVLFFIGCTSEEDEYIEIVKNGSFDEYPSATIGGFLDNEKAFDNVEWQYKKNYKGEKGVGFTGHINTVNNKFLDETIDFTVQIGFLFYANSNTFEVAHALINVSQKKSFNQKFIDVASFDIGNWKNELYKNDLTAIFKKINNYEDFLNFWETEIVEAGAKKAINECSFDKLKQLKDFGLDISKTSFEIQLNAYNKHYANPIEYALLSTETLDYSFSPYGDLYGSIEIESINIENAKKLYNFLDSLYSNDMVNSATNSYFLNDVILASLEYFIEYKPSIDDYENQKKLCKDFIELIEKHKK